MHFTPVLNLRCYFNTQSCYSNTFGYFNTLWCYVQTLGCNFITCGCGPLYAVKAQTSLAPLSWFLGSHIQMYLLRTYVHQCCRFQSYANSHAIPYEIYKRNLQSVNRILGSTTTDHLIRACDVNTDWCYFNTLFFFFFFFFLQWIAANFSKKRAGRRPRNSHGDTVTST